MVNDLADSELLRAYVEKGSHAAFSDLVSRHVDIVYSAALRVVRDPQLAEDVTQGVFIALAKNARGLMDRAVLSGWLHRTTHNISVQTVRTIERRRAREREATAMNELSRIQSESAWETIEPCLDEALAELNEADRDALLLRFFEKKSALEMAGILGVSSEAAQKRVSRAVERLRGIFSKRKISIGAGGLAGLITANAIQSAPAGLAVNVSAAVLAGSAITAITAAGATKTIAMTTLQKISATAVLTALVGIGIYEIHQSARNLKNSNSMAPAARAGSGRAQPAAADIADPAAKAAHSAPATVTPPLVPAPDTNSIVRAPAAPLSPVKESAILPLELPKDSWGDAGFDTPEAALKTRGWAILNGNRERFAESLSITPGARKYLEDMLVQMAQASTDPDRNRMIQEAINNKWGVEEGLLMPLMALNQQDAFTGYRIVSQESPSSDQMILNVETDMTGAGPHQDTLKLQLIDNKWKVVIDEDVLKSVH